MFFFINSPSQRNDLPKFQGSEMLHQRIGHAFHTGRLHDRHRGQRDGGGARGDLTQKVLAQLRKILIDPHRDVFVDPPFQDFMGI